MSPLWLLGEAVTPGVKVGDRFKKNARKLGSAGEELVDVLGVSGCVISGIHLPRSQPLMRRRSGRRKDVVVILDERFNLSKHLNKTSTGGEQNDWGESSRRAAEVIRAAGSVALLTLSALYSLLMSLCAFGQGARRRCGVDVVGEGSVADPQLVAGDEEDYRKDRKRREHRKLHLWADSWRLIDMRR